VDVAVGEAGFAVAARFVDEQVEPLGQFLVEVVADEAEVVLLAHDVARRRQSLALDDVLPHRKAEMIGVERKRELLSAGVRTHDIGM